MYVIQEYTIQDDKNDLDQIIVEHCQDCLGAGWDDLPWWKILIIRNSGSGSSACFFCVHNVIGDCLALVAAFEKLLTVKDGRPIHLPILFRISVTSSSSGLDSDIVRRIEIGKKNRNRKNGIRSTI